LSYNEILKEYKWDEIKSYIYSRTERDVENSLSKEHLQDYDLATLLSPVAEKYIENMAGESHRITVQRFGKTIKIYAPLYVSNTCTNHCTYCGFNHNNEIPRITLSEEEILNESKLISDMGIKHILLVSGESPKEASLDYLRRAVELMDRDFSSISIEVYPMDVKSYETLYKAGNDGLTIYQETYNREKYAQVHPAGKKRDYDWRLDTAERGATAGFRTVGVGTLMGLEDFRTDQFFTGMHARYLMKKFWKTHVTLSFPRIREASGSFTDYDVITDTNLVQCMLAQRLFNHDAGLVISTREPARMRDNLLPLGVTQMSAGSKTDPGGYGTNPNDGKQFEIEDSRSVDDFCNMLRSKGYDPILKDWDRSFVKA